MILISNPIISEINRVNNCGHSSKVCGKKNNLPLILTKSQNPQTKNLKFKAVPGTLRDWDHHHWIPKPILAQNGFDSPPLDPNRGSRGWTSGANQTLRFGWKEKYMIIWRHILSYTWQVPHLSYACDVMTSSTTLKRSILHTWTWSNIIRRVYSSGNRSTISVI